MQTSAMKACFQIAECSLFSAKILFFSLWSNKIHKKSSPPHYFFGIESLTV